MANILEVNKSIDLDVKDGVYKGVFKARIQDIRSNELVITVPIRKGEYVPLRVGTNLEVKVFDESAICIFQCTIKGRKKGNIPLLTLTLPDKFKRIQRRYFYRLKIKLPLYYRPLPAKDEEGEDFKEAEMEDISGGGLLMKVIEEEDYPVSFLLELKVDFPDLGVQLFQGKVAARFQRDKDIFLGIQFFQISTKLQDDIVGWIFQKMRDMRKKGLL